MQRIADIPLAIVGMACRLPGADGLDEFWQLLSEGRSGLGELPPDRLDRELYYDPRKGVRNKSYTSLGGLVPARPFDAETCPLPQLLIDRSHPAHLTLCEVAAAACRNAGLDPFAFPHRNAGVYVGHTPPSALIGKLVYAHQIEHTAQFLREVEGFDQLTGGEQEAVIREIVETVRSDFPPGCKDLSVWGHSHHAPALISRALNLSGPAMAFDAACASSMRALGHGARALQSGQIDMAIIGSASYCNADTLILFSQAQSVSPSGSRPFDEGADGLVAAEGYVVLLVKTLDRAVADGNPVYAVIRGIGVSSDGKGKSLWAPRQEGQIEAIRRAYRSDVSPGDLQYIEMHATSTQVGDATEMSALTTALKDHIPAGTKLPIGSVKANVGHTLETAGLASVVKTVLAMQHGVMPPQINVNKLNKRIDWDKAPFFVPRTALEWPAPSDGGPRRAAVNAFGIGGLNVHIALEQYPTAEGLSALVSKKTGGPRTASDGEAAPQPAFPRSSDEAIAVVGMGAIFPGAQTVEALWETFSSGRDFFIDVPRDRWNSEIGYEPGADRPWRVPSRKGAFITDYAYDWKKHKVPPKQVLHADPLQFMLLDAADQALRQAGYYAEGFDRTRTGVIVGTIFGDEFCDQLTAGLRLPEFQRTLGEILRRRGISEDRIAETGEAYAQVLLKHMPALLDETGSFTASTLSSRITKTFDLMGGAVALDAGDASSFAALNCCIDVLLAGDCDVMVCAAGHRAMNFAYFESMARSGLLARSDPRGPFDSNASGCVPGEGVGVLALKRLSDAERDGNEIHAVIRGIGAGRAESLDESFRLAIQRAFQSDGVRPEDVVVVEAAAKGLPEFDRQELAAVSATYGGGARGEAVRLGTVSGQFGNTGGASGMASLLKAATELNRAEMPGNVGILHPVPEVAQHAEALQLVRDASPLTSTDESGRLIAGVSSFSQYNLAYHVLVEGTTRVPQSQSRPVASKESRLASSEQSRLVSSRSESAWRIIRLGAENWPQLMDKASQTAGEAASLLGKEETAFTAADRVRLAIVTNGRDDLANKLELASKQMTNREVRPLLAEKGIFCNEAFGEPACARGEAARYEPALRVAFLFPGQGSQYTGMLESLVQEFPPAAEALRQVDDVLKRLELPTFAELAWNREDEPGREVWRTQLSMMAADTIMYAAVTALGLRPDRIAGHSFGELAALVAAGSWTFEAAVRATSARCASIDACRDARGVMLMTAAPADVVARLCRDLGGGVSISHLNAPDQTVVGGEQAAVSQLDAAIQAEGFATKVLAVPAAFHTPLMEEVKGPFGRALADIAIQPPSVPLLSSVTNRYVAEPDDIRANLVAQMTRPIDYVGLVERLAAEGPTVFVEVGPRQVLTGLHRSILGDRLVAAVACNHPKRGGLQQLLAARACVETTGALDPQPSGVIRIAPPPASPAGSVSPPAGSPHQNGEPLPQYDGLNVLKLSGTPYEMGLQQGQAQAGQIRRVLRRYADLAGSKWDGLHDLDAAVARAEAYFGSEELEEMRGIAKGADVTFAGVVAHNLRLYLDAGAGGAYFALTAESNPTEGLLHAANEDLRSGLSVRDCLERNIQVRHPGGKIPHIAFGVAGQVGSLNGINARGVAVSTAMLLDAPQPAEARDGRLHTVVVKNVLERAGDIDAAIELLREARGPVAWSVCLSHHASDRVCHVEYDGRTVKVQASSTSVVASNHSVLVAFAEKPEAPSHSRHRLERLKELLGGDRPKNVSIPQAQRVLRDRFDPSRRQESASPTMNTVRRVDNQISIVMQPGRGCLWVTPGSQTNGHQNEFHQLNLADLLPLEKPQRVERTEPARVEPVPAFASETDADTMRQAWFAADENRDPKICRRFAMRVLEVPLDEPADKPLPLHGPALIVGGNPAARALRERLESHGAKVLELPVSEDLDETLAALDRLCEGNLPLHLFLMTAHDEDAETAIDGDDWNRRRSRGVMLPFFVCQRWFGAVAAAKRLDEASVFATAALGGDFGFSGEVRNLEGGALTGLLKGLKLEVEMGHHREYFKAKTIDAAAGASPAELAEFLCREFAAGNKEVEVGLKQGKRYLVRPMPAPLARPQAAERRSSLPAAGPWIVTGGARGVTAVVARELGKRFGLKLHLIGSSPQPDIPETYHHLSPDEMKELRATIMKEALADGERPIDGWQRFEKSLEISKTLRSFAEAGIEATYHACDIGDRAALATVLDKVRAADGPIRGVIHGAGFERACRFEKKQRDMLGKTLAAKVDGAAALMQLTRQDPLEYFAAFTSISGRSGGIGQVDYCAANEMLAKLVDLQRHERRDCRTTAFHWHAWDDVGMAIRPESQRVKELHDIQFMPSREGVEHLIDELLAGLPEPEIVVTELKHYRKRYGPDVEQASGVSDNSGGTTPAAHPAVESAASGNGPESGGGALDVSSLPLIDALPERTERQLTAEICFDPVADVFLAQHRYKERPMLPVVAGLESLAEAAALLAGPGRQVVGLRDIELLNGLRFHADDRQTGRVRAEVSPEGVEAGGISCQLTADFHNRRGQLLQKDRPYLRGVAEVAGAPASFDVSLQGEPETWHDVWYLEEDLVIYHGPAFRCLRQIGVNEEAAFGRLVAPPPGDLTRGRNGVSILPCALLDACFFACGTYLWFKFKGVVAIPNGIRRLQAGRPPRAGESCTLRIDYRGREGRMGLFDFTVFGDDGTVVLHVEGYQNVIVAEEPVNAV